MKTKLRTAVIVTLAHAIVGNNRFSGSANVEGRDEFRASSARATAFASQPLFCRATGGKEGHG